MLPKLNRIVAIGALLVLALLAALFFLGTRIDGDANHSNAARARAELKIIRAALEEFRKTHGRYPDSVDALPSLNQGADGKGSFLSGNSNLKDPWGSPYIYRATQHGYALYSAGPNQRDNSKAGDDVTD